jgi:hypothetical protein
MAVIAALLTGLVMNVAFSTNYTHTNTGQSATQWKLFDA